MPNIIEEEEKEILSFVVPKCGIKADFKRFKNGNWSFSLTDNRDRKRIKRMICKSITNDIMVKLVEDLIGKPEMRERQTFRKSCDIFKSKVETMKDSKKNNKNYAKNL